MCTPTQRNFILNYAVNMSVCDPISTSTLMSTTYTQVSIYFFTLSFLASILQVFLISIHPFPIFFHFSYRSTYKCEEQTFIACNYVFFCILLQRIYYKIILKELFTHVCRCSRMSVNVWAVSYLQSKSPINLYCYHPRYQFYSSWQTCEYTTKVDQVNKQRETTRTRRSCAFQ